jgi:hypothetical protein
MRAKMKVTNVIQYPDAERVSFGAVCKDGGYPSDGSDDDNSFARWTPSADLTMTINNPALRDQFKLGDKFYLDFTPAAA